MKTKEIDLEKVYEKYLISIAKRQLKKFTLTRFEYQYKNGLLFVTADSKCQSEKRKRYHLLVISPGTVTVVYNTSNIIDAHINYSTLDVMQNFIHYVNRLSDEIKDLLPNS